MKLSYITCYLVGLVTMFLSLFVEDVVEPYQSIIKIGEYIIGLIIVVQIMRIDGKRFEDEDEVV